MAKNDPSKQEELKRRRGAHSSHATDLGAKASKDIAGGMNAILADVFSLYLKTKNFHWHMSGPHFRDYHLLLDEQADQMYAMTDPIAERIRKTGGSTLRSIGHIARLQRVKDNDGEYVEPLDMLAELREDNQTLAARCARCTKWWTRCAVSRVRASSRTGSMKPNVVPGSCSKRAGAGTSRDTKTSGAVRNALSTFATPAGSSQKGL